MPDTPFLSSDPNAWMRPYWAELHRQSSFFANLAPDLQIEQLALAVQPDHPAKAQEIREWNPSTPRGGPRRSQPSNIHRLTNSVVARSILT